MKKIIIVLMLVGMLCTAAQANILVNGDFEDASFVLNDTPTAWVAYYTTSAAASPNVNWKNGGRLNGQPYTGDYFVTVTGWTSGYWGSAAQTVPVTAGYDYTLSLATRLIDAGAGGYAGLSLQFYDATNTSMGWTLDTSWTASSAWTYSTVGTYTAPAGAVAARVALWAYGTADIDGDTTTVDPGADTIAYDAVSLVETVPEPLTLSLLGLGGLMLRRKK